MLRSGLTCSQTERLLLSGLNPVPGFRKIRNAGFAAFENKMSVGTPSNFRLNWSLKAAKGLGVKPQSERLNNSLLSTPDRQHPPGRTHRQTDPE